MGIHECGFGDGEVFSALSNGNYPRCSLASRRRCKLQIVPGILKYLAGQQKIRKTGIYLDGERMSRLEAESGWKKLTAVL